MNDRESKEAQAMQNVLPELRDNSGMAQAREKTREEKLAEAFASMNAASGAYLGPIAEMANARLRARKRTLWQRLWDLFN